MLFILFLLTGEESHDFQIVAVTATLVGVRGAGVVWSSVWGVGALTGRTTVRT